MKTRYIGYACLILIFFSVFKAIRFPDRAFAQKHPTAVVNPAPYRKSMTRSDDFVVIQGAALRKSLQKPISKMSLMAAVNGELQPIPFQIDEINSDGEWVLPDHPPYLTGAKVRFDKDDDNGLIDENDELVFMIRDSGNRQYTLDIRFHFDF